MGVISATSLQTVQSQICTFAVKCGIGDAKRLGSPADLSSTFCTVTEPLSTILISEMSPEPLLPTPGPDERLPRPPGSQVPMLLENTWTEARLAFPRVYTPCSSFWPRENLITGLLLSFRYSLLSCITSCPK